MALGKYRRKALRWFGPLAERSTRKNPHLGFALLKAHIRLRPDVYLASTYLTMAVIAAGSLAIVLLILAYSLIVGDKDLLRFLTLLAPLPFLAPAGIYLMALIQPDMKARSRSRDIDAKVPYALNYIATMASAGATPERIFTSLAKQTIYGQVASEAAVISRDLNVMGIDLVTALNKAIDRSPSVKWEDVLQGAITVLTSGGQIKDYFTSKSEQFLAENRQEQGQFLESLGVMAESFVVVVVAAPLFLIVILSVMTMFGGSPKQMLTMGYALTLLMLPLAQVGFGYTIKTMTPEA